MISYGTSGFILRFRKDYSTYDVKDISDVDGLESNVVKVVEFKIYIHVLEKRKEFQVFIGSWNRKNKERYDRAGWLKFILK